MQSYCFRISRRVFILCDDKSNYGFGKDENLEVQETNPELNQVKKENQNTNNQIFSENHTF